MNCKLPGVCRRNFQRRQGKLCRFLLIYKSVEEQQVLYGFASAAERDLFRQLVSVSGIGAQLAIALIDTLGLTNLVQAIVTGNITRLT
jgi:Holliday junction resolvasome RuvABC DNA-binding subunit